ncbi:LysR substrate-binding domain-containing protein [Streptomyces caeruleatus]|uniref:LysR substrate-binding domain-containing protein n=1 Tax=Streptomyces caeruleatus TaxID=661399 RepID=UPI000B1E6D02|nr:LysR substrate-binding domain-containing protein [Streptomyces caeruleatus]
MVTPADWSPSPRSVRDLADRPRGPPPGTACGRALARISAQHAYTPSRAHTARELPTALSLVRAGLGTAVVPTLALTGAPPETVALPRGPGGGPPPHRGRMARFPVRPTTPNRGRGRGLRRSAENLGLTPAP